MIINQIKNNIKEGDVIHKSKTNKKFIVRGWGKSRGENALFYLIPNSKNSNKPYPKGITESDFEKAYQQIIKNGIFSRKWFNQNMMESKKVSPCNFIIIGSIFERFDIATHEYGTYIKKNNIQ